MSDRDGSSESSPSPVRARIACGLAYACAWGVFAGGVWIWPERDGRQGPLERLLAADVDTFVWLGLLMVAPVAWWIRRESSERRGNRAAGISGRWRNWITAVATATKGSNLRAAGWSLIPTAASICTSVWVAGHFDHLPPAYHDEYSYLFQAETFLSGRVSFPSHEAARLFDQMHVLNEGRFASRYFPGTGLWMAPFVSLGNPWMGHWIAGALSAWLIFWCGRELAGDFAGLLAGLLTAVAPGMALFSNLLLAHHPTLVGLGLFLLGFLRCLGPRGIGWGFMAGAGLCFAALCRPMTAAGVAFPFGLYLVCRTASGFAAGSPTGEGWRRLRVLLAVGAPLLAGGVSTLR